MKLEDGFYWARIDCHGRLFEEIVEVVDGEVFRTGLSGSYHAFNIDLGPNTKPIEKPEWLR